MQLQPLISNHLDVVQGAGPLGVAGHLDLLGGRQGIEDVFATSGGQGLELQQLLTHIHLRVASQLADLLDLLFELNEGFFELQQGAAGHGGDGQGD